MELTNRGHSIPDLPENLFGQLKVMIENVGRGPVANDAITNTFTDLITLAHNSIGTPAANFGGSILFNLESNTTPDQNAARIGVLWTDPTHASRDSAVVIQTVTDAGALSEVGRFSATAFEASKVWAGGNSISSGGLPLETAYSLRAVSYKSGVDTADALGLYVRAQSDAAGTTNAITGARIHAEALGSKTGQVVTGAIITGGSSDTTTTTDYVRGALITGINHGVNTVRTTGILVTAGVTHSGSTSPLVESIHVNQNSEPGCTITVVKGLNIAEWSNTGAAIGTAYGIYMDSSIEVGATTSWALYSISAASSLLRGGLQLGAALLPETNDLAALGSATKQWSDLFLAEGGVINWDNGDVTLTQAGNLLTLAGGDFKADHIGIGTSDFTNGLMVIQAPAGTIPSITRWQQLQTGGGGANDRGLYIAFGGGATGVTNRGYFGVTHTGSGSDTFWASEAADAMAFNSLGAVQIGANNAIGITLSTANALRLHAYGAGTLVTDASGNVTASSDATLKTGIRPFTSGLKTILGLDPDYFQWKANPGIEYVGFIAQKIRDVLPEAVGVDPAGLLTLSDRPIIAALVNAIKEQQTLIQKLQERLN